MAIKADPPLPLPTVLAAIDDGARVAANTARTASVPVVRAAMPVVSGRLRKGINGRVGRQPLGYTLTIGASSRQKYPSGVTSKQVLRFVTGGTGIHGPRGRVIRPRKADAFIVNGKPREFMLGQEPQPVLDTAQRQADPVVLRCFDDGSRIAARFAEAIF